MLLLAGQETDQFSRCDFLVVENDDSAVYQVGEWGMLSTLCIPFLLLQTGFLQETRFHYPKVV